MNREILFRGKRANTKEWIYGDVQQNVDAVKIREQEQSIQRIAKSFVVIPETVGQFTGLTDKNGKRIYEGDVMEFVAYGEYNKGVVYIYKGNFGIFCKPPSAHCEASPFLDDAIGKYNAVVIGNVHDNPELLRVRQ